MGSKKRKTEVVAEHEALRIRVGEFEREVNLRAGGILALGTGGPLHGNAGQANGTIPDKTKFNVSPVENHGEKLFHLPGAEIQRYTLLFANAAFEKEYRKEQVKTSIKSVKLWVIWGVLLFSALGLVEWWLIPDHLTPAFLLRYAISIPIFLLSYIATFYFRDGRYVGPSLLISMLTVWLATIIMQIIVGYPANILYTYFMFLVVLFMYGNMGMLFLYTAPASWLLIGMFLIVTLIESGVDLTTMNILHLSFIILLNIIAMFISYNHELTIRRYYRANRIVLLQQLAERELQSHLREAQKMEAVGQLAGGIAHDFNNLLQIIINYAHFARGSLHDTEKLPHFLDNIIRASDRAAALTRQLLAFSRKSVLHPIAIDLNRLTSDLMQMLDRVIGEDIELNLQQDKKLDSVIADQGMIEQVIVNLCVNARDAMPEGGLIRIETENFAASEWFCKTHGWDRPGDYVLLSISDDGEGMTPEVRERLFEPFFTTKDVGQGTGLGLAMVHGIVQQHEGEIEVYSESGIGTNFKIYLPATESKQSEEAVLDVAEISGGSETILVAEDDQGVRELLVDMLDSKGYRVLSAEDGERAVELYRTKMKSIDLVILDAVMPKLKGRKVFDKIRQINPDVVVMFCTGYSENVLDAEFLNTNGLRLIQKPYSQNDLFKNVRELLDQHK